MFEELKGKKKNHKHWQPRHLYPWKIFLRNKGETKVFPDKLKLKKIHAAL